MNKYTTALFFATVFSLVGYFLPKAYFEFSDPKVFYEIESPLSVQPERIGVCQTIVMSGRVKSHVVLEANAQRELVLVDVDGEETVAKFVEKVDLNTTSGEWVFFKQEVEIPCDIDTGIYFFRGRVDFRVHESLKSVEFYTETFEVI